MDLERDWAVGRLATTDPPHAGISCLMRVAVLMETTHLPEISQVSSCMSVARGAKVVTAGLSL
jgi:hypothetical protein